VTVAELLALAQRLLQPRPGMLYPAREARAFLAHLLGCSEASIFAHPEWKVEAGLSERFLQLCRRRQAGEPFHLILGSCPFFGRDFSLVPGVLIPRPETELLVEAALTLPLPPKPRILDVGTGSGVLGITLALELPQAQVFASDLFCQPLELARRNARAKGARVHFALMPLAQAWRGPFHLVVANLPYLPEGLPTPPELAFEPPQALFAGPDGLALLLPFLHSLPGLLASGGFALLEVGEGQAEVLLGQMPPSLQPLQTLRDASGSQRGLLLARP
jgi:release factor glutamine methyltransferase